MHALSLTSDWLTVSEWACKFAEIYHDLLVAADAQAAKQKNDSTGLREIAAHLSSRLISGGFRVSVVVHASESHKKFFLYRV